MNRILAALLMLLMAGPVLAKPAFTGTDYSGVYDCTGKDAGADKSTVTLTLLPEHSLGPYAGYDFKLEVPGSGTYLGNAATSNTHRGMHFVLTNEATGNHGRGSAIMKTNAAGSKTFRKFSYQLEHEGGNTTIENCVKR
jgi:hypothetical protein